MKVKDYIEGGLKNFVEDAPSDYKEIGRCKKANTKWQKAKAF